MARVLIIDDDPQFRDLLSRRAQREGTEALAAGTLAQGLAKARTERPDVVFLDVHLPDGNGLNVIPELRASAGAPEVIIVTGGPDPEGAELAVRSGAWD